MLQHDRFYSQQKTRKLFVAKRILQQVFYLIIPTVASVGINALLNDNDNDNYHPKSRIKVISGGMKPPDCNNFK